MRSWKVILGLTAACAACCAIPLLGLAGGLAAFGSALWACADEVLPLAAMLLVAAFALTGVWWWKRRQARNVSCNCTTSCSTGATNA
jgi:hypothetical protein